MKYLNLILSIILIACSNSKIEADRDEIIFVPSYTSPPFIIIYKTKANYDSLIPIGLNESKTQIVSYPAPSDIKSIYGFPTPVRLEDNYLLDKRGINKHTVFLDISYSEYAKYEKSPDTDTLMKHIINYNPFTEIWNCGSKYSYSDAISQINQIIKAKQINIFRKVL